MLSTLLPICMLNALAGTFAEVRAAAPGFWQSVSAAQAKRLGPPRLKITAYRVFRLDLAGMKKVLATASANETGPRVLLPLPNGTLVAYHMRTTSVMAPELAARYPNLRTYAGQEAATPANDVRLELTPAGLRAMLIRNGRTFFIEPYRPGNTEYYLCFDKASLPAGSKAGFETPGR